MCDPIKPQLPARPRAARWAAIPVAAAGIGVEEARAFQARTVKAYLKGDRRPYTQKFSFKAPEGGTGYPDHEPRE